MGDSKSQEQARSLDRVFQAMWADYCRLSPAAERIHALLVARGESVVNDHIALRTFRHPTLGLEQVAKPFEALGYRRAGEYVFEQKKLFARHWEHDDPDRPKIFISELEVEKFSPRVQEIVGGLADQVAASSTSSADFFFSGRPWGVSRAVYEELAAVSEYASWVAAYGFRPNHFTVLVNRLRTFKGLDDLNLFIEANGYRLNASGGKIKGTPEELLEQSSTVAEEVSVSFDEGSRSVPSVYYEFARRYPGTDGKIYQGFIAKSADKIFESTDRRSN